MSGIKRHGEDLDGLRQTAQDLLIETGYASRCEYCDDVTDAGAGDNPVEAYKLGNARISANEIELCGGVTRTDFSDMIKEELIQLPSECHCEHQMNKD